MSGRSVSNHEGAADEALHFPRAHWNLVVRDARLRRAPHHEGWWMASENSGLVTTSDLRETVAELKVDLIRWLTVTQIALGGFVFAAVKFVK